MIISSLLIIANIFFIEVLLSIDNAAVLAIMVKHLSPKEAVKALRYGILGAYLFRGLCLFFVSFLIGIWFLKLIGGLYLIYLGIKSLTPSEDNNEPQSEAPSRISKLKNSFWGTVLLVEAMDLVFSVDNIFAVVAMSKNIYLICIGVFIGIAAIRFISQGFVRLLNKFPSLEKSACIVIILLGIKLCVYSLFDIKDNESFDMVFSLGMLLVFFTPLTIKLLKNYKTK